MIKASTAAVARAASGHVALVMHLPIWLVYGLLLALAVLVLTGGVVAVWHFTAAVSPLHRSRRIIGFELAVYLVSVLVVCLGAAAIGWPANGWWMVVWAPTSWLLSLVVSYAVDRVCYAVI
jgi:hypothetical protein